MAAPTYEYRQRANERVYEAPVTSVRAVMGPPEQRCWVEREQVVERGKDVAAVGGAVAGALIGGNSSSGATLPMTEMCSVAVMYPVDAPHTGMSPTTIGVWNIGCK